MLRYDEDGTGTSGGGRDSSHTLAHARTRLYRRARTSYTHRHPKGRGTEYRAYNLSFLLVFNKPFGVVTCARTYHNTRQAFQFRITIEELSNGRDKHKISRVSFGRQGLRINMAVPPSKARNFRYVRRRGRHSRRLGCVEKLA